MVPMIAKLQSRARDKILDCARHQNLPRTRSCGYTRPNMNRKTTHFFTHNLYLASVHASAYFYAK